MTIVQMKRVHRFKLEMREDGYTFFLIYGGSDCDINTSN